MQTSEFRSKLRAALKNMIECAQSERDEIISEMSSDPYRGSPPSWYRDPDTGAVLTEDPSQTLEKTS